MSRSIFPAISSRRQADALRKDFPDLAVYPVAADFTAPFALPAEIAGMPKVGFFPGSTLGNFEPHEASAFLRSAREILGEGAQMIIGVDLEKNERVLYDAYNDAAGVTARFNLNVLVRINRELGGNFDISAFMHRSIYNRERHRIEMHLIAKKAQIGADPGPEFFVPPRRKHPHRVELQIQPRTLHRAGARIGLVGARRPGPTANRCFRFTRWWPKAEAGRPSGTRSRRLRSWLRTCDEPAAACGAGTMRGAGDIQ